jgi:hypothetical protein
MEGTGGGRSPSTPGPAVDGGGADPTKGGCRRGPGSANPRDRACNHAKGSEARKGKEGAEASAAVVGAAETIIT